MTKKELIKLLQNDKSPDNIQVNIYLECINNDTGIFAKLVGTNYDKRFKELTINGTYQECEY